MSEFSILTRKIALRGKHAVGDYQFAIVDVEDFAYLNQWQWKAKPNGSANNVYAVRNSKVDGKWVTIRMHRIVLGLSADDPRDVDHMNHDALDNRRVNLRAVSRSVNILNRRPGPSGQSMRHGTFAPRCSTSYGLRKVFAPGVRTCSQ